MSDPVASQPSTLVAWCQLTRIGLVFSAPSNILLGAFLAIDWREWPAVPLLLLCLSSSLLYLSGMVLNDWCDRSVDATERPSRPIPSGRIQASTALSGGLALMVAGLLAAGVASLVLQCPLAVGTATLVAMLIWLYNGWAKTGPFGPWVMGACRGANVLLGASLATEWPGLDTLLGALAVATVIGAITTMARHETGIVPVGVVRLSSIGLLAPFLVMILWMARDPHPATPWSALLAFWLAWRFGSLLERLLAPSGNPEAPRIIGGLLGLLIPVDALLASTHTGFAGFLILGLWIAAMQFRRFRWLYAS